MSSENKQRSNPLCIPQFTPANYGSFFLAGQSLYPVSPDWSQTGFQEHYVLRALMHYLPKAPSTLTAFS